MYRVNNWRVIKLAFLFIVGCIFFLTQHIAVHYHSTSYRINRNVNELNIGSVVNNIYTNHQDDPLVFDRLKSINQLLFTNNTVHINYTCCDLLDKYNLSIPNFDPKSNKNDKILLLSLQQVNQVDQHLWEKIRSESSPVEVNIHHRRQKGQQTSLKASEFAPITRIRYGAQMCDKLFYGGNLSVIIFVITKPEDFQIRSLIRSTWGKQFQQDSSPTRLYFCFGETSEQKFTSKPYYSKEMVDVLIRKENDLFGDVIQWMFEDGYYRLTIKSLAIVRWASVYCPLVSNVFKVDADHLVNYDNLIRFCDFLKNKSATYTNHPVLLDDGDIDLNNTYNFTVYGKIWQKAKVIRSHKSKFFTSFYDYSNQLYPDYIGGPWFLTRTTHALLLYSMSVYHSMPALLWEDLYLTGIVGQNLLLSHVPFDRKQMSGFQYDMKATLIDSCRYNQSIIFTQTINEFNLVPIWNQIHNHTLTSTKKSNCSFIL